MDTYPHKHQHEDKEEVRGKDNREIDRGIPCDGVENVWNIRVTALRPRNARPQQDDNENRKIYRQPVEFTEVHTSVGTLLTECKRE